LIFMKDSGRAVIEDLFGDALSFQSMILMAEAHFDAWGGRRSDYMSHMHLKTLHLLRTRLSIVDETLRVANPTLFAIAGLVLHARIFGEDDSAKHHLEGIRKIVDLRGGLVNFTQPTKLITEILRYVSARFTKTFAAMSNNFFSDVTLAWHSILAENLHFSAEAGASTRKFSPIQT
jgi:hypothetical protein